MKLCTRIWDQLCLDEVPSPPIGWLRAYMSRDIFWSDLAAITHRQRISWKADRISYHWFS